jgi:hypothetical protein
MFISDSANLEYVSGSSNWFYPSNLLNCHLHQKRENNAEVNKMKIRTLTLVALAIMMVSMFTVTAMAKDQLKTQDQLKDGTCLDSTTFVDADGNGVCDNYADAICDGSNCKGTGDRDGNQDRARDGSCQA